MAGKSERPPDIVLTPEQAQRARPLVSDIVSSLSRRLEFQHFQLTGNHEAAAMARTREEEANRDTSRFLVDDDRAAKPAAGSEDGRPSPASQAAGPPSGVLGRDLGPATVLNSLGPGSQPATVTELQQGTVTQGQPSNQPFGLPGGPTVGVAGVTSGVGAGAGMGMGMGMGGGMGARGGGQSTPPKVLGRADPEIWGSEAPDQQGPGAQDAVGRTLAGGGTAPGRGDAGGEGPSAGGVLGRRR
ncbi:hypothetical protein [Streptomyces sp. NPDC058548]|uniref:hypothetical protein n=1 Tax=unclassified Streptomyces TaxID=2593676 RepID=UPI003651A349